MARRSGCGSAAWFVRRSGRQLDGRWACCSSLVGFVHANRGEDAGGGGEGGDGGGGGADAVGVGEDAGEQGADGEATVAPQAVDADGAGAPGGMCDVADGGEQGRVHEGGAGAEQDGGERPGGERVGGGDPGEGGGLEQHAGDDEGFAAVAVGQRAGGELAEAILKWLVSVGDTVTLNQPIVEIETAKAAVEIVPVVAA